MRGREAVKKRVERAKLGAVDPPVPVAVVQTHQLGACLQRECEAAERQGGLHLGGRDRTGARRVDRAEDGVQVRHAEEGEGLTARALAGRGGPGVEEGSAAARSPHAGRSDLYTHTSKPASRRPSSSTDHILVHHQSSASHARQ